MINRFVIRVYGLLYNNNDEVLLVQEKIAGMDVVKFPGGGLEFGEGLKEALVREFMEETGVEVEVTDHFYTTDFFQQSAFRSTDQVISVYYTVRAPGGTDSIRLDEFELSIGGKTEQMRFFWVKNTSLHEDMLTLPIDKIVARIASGATRNS